MHVAFFKVQQHTIITFSPLLIKCYCAKHLSLHSKTEKGNICIYLLRTSSVVVQQHCFFRLNIHIYCWINLTSIICFHLSFEKTQ